MENSYTENIRNNLNKEQLIAYETMCEGNSVFITGNAGTGKSYVVKKYYEEAVKKYGSGSVFKTSSTGVSALIIGGKTLHSWAGIFLGEGTVETILRKMPISARDRWRNVKVLFIDEISMIHPELFDKLEEIARIMKRSSMPFGGIQIICSGDFFQLSPVSKDNLEKFCFEAQTWDKVIKHTITLKNIVRQKDPIFQKLLDNAKYGTLTKEDIDILESRVGVELTNDSGIEPTILFSKNADVNYVNNKKLNEILKNNEKYIYKSIYKVEFNHTDADNKTIIEQVSKSSNDLIPEEITLAVGAQVIFKKNIPDTYIANGTRGVVISFKQTDTKSEFYPLVKLLNGSTFLATPIDFEFESSNEYKLIKKQIPIKLAWAASIHSSQGSTLEYVKLDIGHTIFVCGQAYVGLSRCKSLENLTLIDFTPKSIKANSKVIKKYPRKE